MKNYLVILFALLFVVAFAAPMVNARPLQRIPVFGAIYDALDSLNARLDAAIASLNARIDAIPAAQQGPQGIPGPQGVQGVAGPQGIQGMPGPAGVSSPRLNRYIVINTTMIPANAGTDVVVLCQPGDQILSGGFTSFAHVTQSRPYLVAEGWIISATTISDVLVSAASEVTVYAWCNDITP